MPQLNHYLALLQNKSNSSMNSLVLEIALMHNALGVALKDFFSKYKTESQTIKQLNSNVKLKQTKNKYDLYNKSISRSISKQRQEKKMFERPTLSPKCKFQKVTRGVQGTQGTQGTLRPFMKPRVRQESPKFLNQKSQNDIPQPTNLFSTSSSFDLAIDIQSQEQNYKQKQKAIHLNIETSSNSNSPINTRAKSGKNSEYECLSSQSQRSKRPIYREGLKHNKNKQNLQGYSCQMCQKFYANNPFGNKTNVCHHSRHQTTAAYSKINNFSQAFDDI